MPLEVDPKRPSRAPNPGKNRRRATARRPSPDPGCARDLTHAQSLRANLDLVLSSTSGYAVVEHVGQLVLIGDNGGDFFYALDYAANPPVIVGGSFLANDRGELELLGHSLGDFLTRMVADA